MELEELDLDPGYCSASSSNNVRNIQYFNITGRTLVHPVSYQIQTFQKDIIKSATMENTLISLPPGLGKLYIAAVTVFNFNRWFLNGKILILSQSKSYLTDLMSAFNDYTPLSKETYSELPAKDSSSISEKSIILTSPQKCVDVLNNNILKLHNIVLLLIFETSKIIKCQEYKEIMNKLKEFEFRILLSVDPTGFNSKILKQVVDDYKISKIEIRNLDSADVKECTFHSEIESITVDVSSHIGSIKDSFYSVFEKYGKKLKDAKVVTGNVANLSKVQIQKAKEKFQKNLPLSMPKNERDDLIDCMTIGAFLCHGIELLHNWGVQTFYNYLFDEGKEDELKALIVKDEHLMKEMKLLNDYLKLNGRNIDTSLSMIMHPKLQRVKKLVAEYFSGTEADIVGVRIVVLCSVDDVIDELDRAFRDLPDCIRWWCIKTKAKCLASEPKHKEIVQNFLDGVINVLVVSNLVDEIMEIKTSVIISLDPNKTLLKNADARFFEGTKSCVFVLTRGMESVKFETYLNEKCNEQKTLDIDGVETVVHESSHLFPEDFNPKFECTGINIPKKDFKNSPGQKTLLKYLKPSPDCSPSLFEKTDDSAYKSRTSNTNRCSDLDSPSLFTDDFKACSPTSKSMLAKEFEDDGFHFDDDLIPMQPSKTKKLLNFDRNNDDQDSCDELIFDFTDSGYRKTEIPVRNFGGKENMPAKISLVKESAHISQPKKFSWIKKSIEEPSKPWNSCDKSKSNTFTENVGIHNDALEKPSTMGTNRNIKDCEKPKPQSNTLTVEVDIHKDAFGDTSLVLKPPTVRTNRYAKNDNEVVSMLNVQDESFVDFLFTECSPEDVSKDCERSNSFLFSKDTNVEKTANDSRNLAIDSMKINCEDEIDALAAESFVDDLFSNSIDMQQIDDTQDIKREERQTSLPAHHHKKSTDETQDEEIDSDEDIVPGSPDTKRSCEIFSSRNIETLTQNSSSSAKKVAADMTVKSSSFEATRNKVTCDLFPATTEVRVGDVRCSLGDKEHDTAANSNVRKPTSLEISQSEIPRERLTKLPSGVTLKNQDSTKWTPASPILSSSKKNPRWRSKISLGNNQTESIRFDSSFDISDDQLDKVVKNTVEGFKSSQSSATKKPNTRVYDFDTVFDSELFLNIPDELPPISCSSPIYCNTREKLNSANSAADNFQSSMPRGSSTPNNPSSVKSSLLMEANRKLPSPKLKSTDLTNNNCKTPDQVFACNASSPDDLIFDGYSTPVINRTTVQSKFNSGPENHQRSAIARSSLNKKANNSFDFSDSSIFLGDYSTPSRIATGLKGRSAVINSDTGSSTNASTSTINKSSSIAASRRLSTMERLNGMSTSKGELSSPGSPSSRGSHTSCSPSWKSSSRAKSMSLFSNFAQKMKQKIEQKQDESNKTFASPVPAPRNILDSDEEFSWLDMSPINREAGLKKRATTPFKKPEPFMNLNSASRHSTPVSTSSDGEVHLSPMPCRVLKRNSPAKRKRLKRNLAKQFIDKEAEVSGDDSSEEDCWLDGSQFSVDSFIDDDPNIKSSNMTTNYLKSIKSPSNVPGNFHIRVASASKLKKNVFSQAVDYEQSYEQDSFCVDDDNETEAEVECGVLTQMEEKLQKKSFTKPVCKPKPNQFKRIISNISSSPDSPDSADLQKNTRKRVKCFSSSDSDAD